MSFVKANENFLKFGFDIPLRGLGGAARLKKYQHEIKKEARIRFRRYFDDIHKDISQKKDFYEELIKRFGDLEPRFLLYSIYFDAHSDELIAELSPLINQYVFLDDEPLKAIFMSKITKHENSITKGYLKSYFVEVLKLDSGEWEAENGTYNPLTYKLVNTIIGLLSSDTNSYKLHEVLVNYTRLWNIYFALPFNISKALILVNKLFEAYKKVNINKIAISLGESVSDINLILDDLLPQIVYSPLTDSDNSSALEHKGLSETMAKVERYLVYNLEFHQFLIEDKMLFKNISDIHWPKLLLKFCVAEERFQEFYSDEINTRNQTGSSPRFSDIERFLKYFEDTETRKRIDPKRLDIIMKTNYLFFDLDHQSS